MADDLSECGELIMNWDTDLVGKRRGKLTITRRYPSQIRKPSHADDSADYASRDNGAGA